jgi:hypothetical protein
VKSIANGTGSGAPCSKTTAIGWRSAMNGTPRHSGWSWWYLLFVIQFVAVLWPPFFNKAEPAWIGLPFFYWYQLLWVLIGAVLTAVVYFATDRAAPR